MTDFGIQIVKVVFYREAGQVRAAFLERMTPEGLEYHPLLGTFDLTIRSRLLCHIGLRGHKIYNGT